MNKVILVTGASTGIGHATAKYLAEQGHIVYAAARRVEKMQDLTASGVKILSMDVTDDASMISGVNTILKNEKRIDVLVNNAGYGSFGALEDVPISEAKNQFEVNVFGMARLTQLVLPHLREQKSGTIINVSSMGGKFGEPHGSWYHATKYAVEGLSDSLRMELKQFGIDVVIIEPGSINTEWTGIAKDNLLKISGNTAYKDLATKHANFFAKIKGSDPIVIAKVIAQAVESTKPKTRYVAGDFAKPLLFLRRMVSDRIFDSIMLNNYR